MTARVLFVGWDGADWSVLDRLAGLGLMPTLMALRAGGAEGTLRSTFPPHSVAAWTSFLTGLAPRDHGIVDFTRCRPGRAFPDAPYTAEDVPRPTLLDLASAAGLRVFAGNIPMTYPPRPLNGALIAGVFLPEGARYTYPPDLQDRLAATGGFPLNAMSWAQAADLGALFLEAREVVGRRTEAFVQVMADEPWDLALVAYMAPDRLQHPAMHLLDPAHALHDRDHGLAEPLHAVFEELDRALARLIDAAQPEELVLASDHGFRSVWQDLVPNRILESLGYLRFRLGPQALRRVTRPLAGAFRRSALAVRAARSLSGEGGLDWDGTVAYAPSVASQGFRLNVAGRDPFGSLPASKADSTIARLIADLRELRTRDGDPCFARVFAAEDEIQNFARLPGMPDIFYEPGPHLGVTSDGTDPVRPVRRKTGEHRAEGVVLRHEPGPLPGAIWEVARLLGSLAGISDQWPGAELAAPTGTAVSAQEERAVVEQLRGLGYID